MNVDSLDFDCISGLSDFDKHYVRSPDDFNPYIESLPALSSIEPQLIKKSNSISFDREKLALEIKNQYEENGDLTNENEKKINRLRSPNAFTIITAHQPSLLTGPLYFVHKILSAIVTAESVQKHYPEKKIIPVFIIGGEDHDFEEMNHLHYRNDLYTWKEEDVGNAVGRMSTEGVVAVIEELAPSLSQSYYGKEMVNLLKDSFSNASSVASGTQLFVSRLFSAEPLLVVQMDNAIFKEAFTPIIVKEVLDQQSIGPIEQTQKDLREIGYGDQALAREINFFYLYDGNRRRIIRDGDYFEVLDSKIRIPITEMENHIKSYPERFSPNVVMRPIYQEFIFPNIAYVGGGGEIAYWMERKRQFESFEIPFPLLLRRHSATIIIERNWNKMKDLPFQMEDWFSHIHTLEAKWLELEFSDEIDLSESYKKLHFIFDELREKMANVDETLLYSNEAARVDSLKPLKRLKKKLKRALKSKEAKSRESIRKIHSEIYPKGNLQERYVNFLEYYERRGPQLFTDIKDSFVAFEPRMSIVRCP